MLAAAEQRHDPAPRFQPFSLMPAAERDLAVVVNQAVGSGALTAAIQDAGQPLLEAVHYLSRFDGGDLTPDTCSHAFRLVFRGDRTLTDSPTSHHCYPISKVSHGEPIPTEWGFPQSPSIAVAECLTVLHLAYTLA